MNAAWRFSLYSAEIIRCHILFSALYADLRLNIRVPDRDFVDVKNHFRLYRRCYGICLKQKIVCVLQKSKALIMVSVSVALGDM